MDKLLTVTDVANLLRLDKNLIYKLVKIQEFPQPIMLSKRKYRWLEIDIENWLLTKKE